jgi:WD40 repeat protein
MPSKYEIVDPYNYRVSEEGPPFLTQFGGPEEGKEPSSYRCVCIIIKDGNINIVSGESTGQIKIWDSSGTLIKSVEGPFSVMNSLCWLDNGYVASGSGDNIVRVWDMETGGILKELNGHTSSVNSVCALGAGRLASASWDGTVRVWDVETEKCLKVLEGGMVFVFSVCSLGGDLLASGSADGKVRVWDVETDVETEKCLKVLEGHTNHVLSVCDLGYGRLASGSADGTVRVWDINTGQCLNVLEGHKESVHSLCYLGNNRLVSLSQFDKTMRVWDLNNQENYKLLKINIVSTGLHSLDENRFLSINKLNDEEKSISICDITYVDRFPKPVRSKIGQRLQNWLRGKGSTNPAKVAPAPTVAATPAATVAPRQELKGYKSSAKVAPAPAANSTVRGPQGGAEGGGFSRRRVPRRKNRKTRRKNKGISRKFKKSKKSKKSRKSRK